MAAQTPENLSSMSMIVIPYSWHIWPCWLNMPSWGKLSCKRNGWKSLSILDKKRWQHVIKASEHRMNIAICNLHETSILHITMVFKNTTCSPCENLLQCKNQNHHAAFRQMSCTLVNRDYVYITILLDPLASLQMTEFTPILLKTTAQNCTNICGWDLNLPLDTCS